LKAGRFPCFQSASAEIHSAFPALARLIGQERIGYGNGDIPAGISIPTGSGGAVYVFACYITGGEHPSEKAARAIVENVFKSQNLLYPAAYQLSCLSFSISMDESVYIHEKLNSI
jgi:hypothetical protein